jgi:hypothetical protein
MVSNSLPMRAALKGCHGCWTEVRAEGCNGSHSRKDTARCALRGEVFAPTLGYPALSADRSMPLTWFGSHQVFPEHQ